MAVKESRFLNMLDRLLRSLEMHQWRPVIRRELHTMRRDMDPEHNRSTTPPESEKIHLRSVWIAECYPASRVSNLVDGLRKLGWLENPSTLGQSVEKWLEDSRSAGDSSHWQNVGSIYPKGTPLFGPALAGTLPEGVESVYFYLFGMGSNLTVATFQFNMTNAVRLDAPLRSDFRTISEATGRSSLVRFLQPYHRKERALTNARAKLHRRLSGWIAERIPGVFAAGTANQEFPSCDFITFTNAIPCEEGNEGMNDWRRIFGLTSDWNTWRSDLLGTAILRLPRSSQEQLPRYRLELLANEEQFLASFDTKHYGDGPIDAAKSKMAIPMANLIALWASNVLLQSWERQMAALRDRFGDLARSKPNTDRGVIVDARAAVQMLGYDVGLVAASLVRMSEDPVNLPSEVPDFREASKALLEFYERTGRESQMLHDRLINSIRFRGDSVSRTAASLRDSVGLETAIVSSSVNLRLQRTLTVLTWVLVGLAIATLVLAFLQFDLALDSS